jgi:ACS family hexuronate transporter-like MFS transporter
LDAALRPALNSPVAARPSSYRWRICALLFFATTINYMDRQVLGVLAPELQKSIGWSELQYGYIITAFQAAYAMGLLVVGGVIDRVGTRIGYAIVISLWSMAAMGHALVQSALGFGIARFFLGLGESGNFPAAIKTVAEWFPQKDRALATGIFNSGSNIGAIVAPLLVPLIALRLGWRYAFLFTGTFSALWLISWLTIYRPPRSHSKVSASELAYIESGAEQPASKIPWARLLPLKQTWAIIIGKFLTDPVWWFFLYWLPKFLNSRHGLSLVNLGPPLVAIYLMADVGSIGGGWIPAALLRRGWSVNRARKTAMLICGLCVIPIVTVPYIENLWLAVGIIGVAAASHQGFSANMYTLGSDMFPRRAIASITGIGGFGGSVGGMLVSTFTGVLLEFTGSYVPVFILAGSAYLTAIAIIHLLVPKLEPAAVE